MKPTSHGGHGHPSDEMHNDGVAHETSDVNVRAILSFGGIVVATTVVCAVIVWGFFNLLESQAAARDPNMSPLAMPASPMPGTTASSPFFGNAQGPQLIVSEPTVLRMQRQTEDEHLHQYGWVDQNAGVARIPIDQAKKLLVERGLPSRAAASGAELGTHAPAFGDANGGRTIPSGEGRGAAAPATPQAPAPASPEVPKEPAHAPSGRGAGV